MACDFDLGLIPLSYRQQINSEVWPKARTHVSQTEIEGVQGTRGPLVDAAVGGQLAHPLSYLREQVDIARASLNEGERTRFP
jgi:hypothetical protein